MLRSELRMSKWERFYRLLGGRGPEDNSAHVVPEDLGAFHMPSAVGNTLIKLGFLKMDPDLPKFEAAWIVNYHWQWRFWRGPYRDVALARDLEPPSWWDSWRRRWREWR